MPPNNKPASVNIMKYKLLTVVLSSLVLSACASKKAAEPVSPYTEAEQVLLDAYKTDYDAGEYKALIKKIKESPVTKDGTAAFREESLKYKAFSECISKMPRSCRATFRTLFSENPSFALSIAEEGHPAWKSVYAAERKRAARLVKPATKQ